MEYFSSDFESYLLVIYCLEQVLIECQNLVKIIVVDMLKLFLSCQWLILLFASGVPGQEKKLFDFFIPS